MVFNALVHSAKELQIDFSKKVWLFFLINQFVFSLYEIIGKMGQKWYKIDKGSAIRY